MKQLIVTALLIVLALAVMLPAESASGPGGAQVVTTLSGDRLIGRVLTIDSAGKIRLTGPQFDGEMSILSSAVDTVTLNGKSAEGKDELQLSNGDRLRGEIVSITSSTILINTPAAGNLNVNRRFVRAVMIGRLETVLLDSDFSKGLAPWTNTSPPGEGRNLWKVENGYIVARSNGERVSMWARLDQKEAVTLVCTFQAISKNPGLFCDFVLFSDRNQNWCGINSVFANINRANATIEYAHDNGTDELRPISLNVNGDFRGGTIHFAYDPETFKAHLWVDEQDLGEFDMPNKLTKGFYVIVSPQSSIKVEKLRVLRGVVPPVGAKGNMPDPADATAVQFANKDRLSAQSISLADGQFVIATAHGELKSPLDAVQCIVFGKKETEEQRRQKGDVRVDLGSSRLTVHFGQLTEEALLGCSDALGDVEIKRAAIRSVAFNLKTESEKPVETPETGAPARRPRMFIR